MHYGHVQPTEVSSIDAALITRGTHCHPSPGLGHPSPQWMCLLVAARAASLPAGFVGHDAPPDTPQCFPVLASEAKAGVQPHTLTNTLVGNPRVFITCKRH